ncbi:MAG: hypothetical protein RR510_10980 [Morganella sp. (in: enterobacteria)]
MSNFDKADGQFHEFTSPLNEGDFFALPVESSVPEGVTPIIDESTGLCIGYLYGMNGVYHIYDINGHYQTVYEIPLESPLFDPLDLLLIGGVVAKLCGRTSLLMRGGATRAVSSGGVKLSMQIVSSLKSRLTLSSAATKMKYSPQAARAMSDRSRYVPDYILSKVIRNGRQTEILIAASGEQFNKYSMTIKKYRYGGQLMDVYLNVIVDADKKIITEFNY